MKRTFAAAPFTTLRISLEIHPDIPALQAAYKIRAGWRDSGVQAFCFCRDGKGGIAAELHFARDYMAPGVIAHEALHAALILGRHIYVNPEEESGEELLADTVQTIMDECLAAKRELRASTRRSK